MAVTGCTILYIMKCRENKLYNIKNVDNKKKYIKINRNSAQF